MFLKSFPDDVELAALVETAFVLLQSTLMRAQELIDAPTPRGSGADVAAMTTLVQLLDTAKHDAEKLQKRMMN